MRGFRTTGFKCQSGESCPCAVMARFLSVCKMICLRLAWISVSTLLQPFLHGTFSQVEVRKIRKTKTKLHSVSSSWILNKKMMAGRALNQLGYICVFKNIFNVILKFGLWNKFLHGFFSSRFTGKYNSKAQWDISKNFNNVLRAQAAKTRPFIRRSTVFLSPQKKKDCGFVNLALSFLMCVSSFKQLGIVP